MKVFARIFLIWFCLLNVQPLISYAATSVIKKEICAKKCCQSSPKKEKSNANNCCKNGTCNPLVSCSCCFYVGHKEDALRVQKITSLIGVISSDIKFSIINSSSTCFHPPEKLIFI